MVAGLSFLSRASNIYSQETRLSRFLFKSMKKLQFNLWEDEKDSWKLSIWGRISHADDSFRTNPLSYSNELFSFDGYSQNAYYSSYSFACAVCLLHPLLIASFFIVPIH